MAVSSRLLCQCPYDYYFGKQTHRSDCPYAPAKLEDAAIVQEQIDGDPLVIQSATRSDFEAELSRLVNHHSMEKNTPDFMLAKFMVLTMNLFQQLSDERDRWKGPGENDANFGFYVDGYTLTGTPIIGEILVTAMDGRSAIIKSASLVAFLDRRLSPNVFAEDKPQG